MNKRSNIGRKTSLPTQNMLITPGPVYLICTYVGWENLHFFPSLSLIYSNASAAHPIILIRTDEQLFT